MHQGEEGGTCTTRGQCVEAVKPRISKPLQCFEGQGCVSLQRHPGSGVQREDIDIWSAFNAWQERPEGPLRLVYAHNEAWALDLPPLDFMGMLGMFLAFTATVSACI